ncbi:MAG: hypothetical protein PPP56_11880 [Longimonas sp.]|uniref:hypothetical protein n=1 Tax=Longimonas sp. TaxID=2039626 RepID=UPI003359092B
MQRSASKTRHPASRASTTTSTPPPANTLGGNRPRTVLDVLCRELGTSHPDAALRQIRTMKRLLREHHRAGRKLRRVGIDGADEAAREIASLEARIRTLKEEHKARAEERIAVIETMAKAIEMLRRRLREQATTAEGQTAASPTTSSPSDDQVASSEEPAGAADSSRVDNAHSELDELNTLLQRLRSELDEIRLELWCYQKEDEELPSYPDDGRMAHTLLDRIEQKVSDTADKHDQLFDAYQRVMQRIDPKKESAA